MLQPHLTPAGSPLARRLAAAGAHPAMNTEFCGPSSSAPEPSGYQGAVAVIRAGAAKRASLWAVAEARAAHIRSLRRSPLAAARGPRATSATQHRSRVTPATVSPLASE